MKKNILTFPLAVTAACIWAGEAIPQEMDTLVACADLKDSRQRLECYDQGIVPYARARAAAAAAPAEVVRAPAPIVAPAAASSLPASAPTVPASSLGEEQLPGSRKPATSAEEMVLHARISELRPAGDGFLVTLDNGQIWHHEDQYQGAYLKQGESVTIRRAVLGVYRLTRDAGESRNWIRVTRVR